MTYVVLDGKLAAAWGKGYAGFGAYQPLAQRDSYTGRRLGRQAANSPGRGFGPIPQRTVKPSRDFIRSGLGYNYATGSWQTMNGKQSALNRRTATMLEDWRRTASPNLFGSERAAATRAAALRGAAGAIRQGVLPALAALAVATVLGRMMGTSNLVHPVRYGAWRSDGFWFRGSVTLGTGGVNNVPTLKSFNPFNQESQSASGTQWKGLWITHPYNDPPVTPPLMSNVERTLLLAPGESLVKFRPWPSGGILPQVPTRTDRGAYSLPTESVNPLLGYKPQLRPRTQIRMAYQPPSGGRPAKASFKFDHNPKSRREQDKKARMHPAIARALNATTETMDFVNVLYIACGGPPGRSFPDKLQYLLMGGLANFDPVVFAKEFAKEQLQDYAFGKSSSKAHASWKRAMAKYGNPNRPFGFQTGPAM